MKININLFDYDRSVYPLQISEKNYNDIVNMLMISNKDKNHFVLIKNFNKLMYNKTKHHGKKHFCKNCLHCFYSERSLAMHKDRCYLINDCVAVNLPKPFKDKNGRMRKPTLYFRNYNRRLPVPFVIYADFEAIIEKMQCNSN